MGKILPKALTTFAVLLTASTAYLYYQNSQVPNLGLDNGRLKPLSSKPNCISSQATDLSKRVDPLPFGEGLEKTMNAVKSAVETHGGHHILKEEADYLHVVFSTPVMKFNDDVEFLLDEESKEVHFRAAARAGYSDMGNNRKRYEKLREIYLRGVGG